MSKIQEALKKLQKGSPPRSDPNADPAISRKLQNNRSAIPIARKKKVTIEGHKHPANAADLDDELSVFG